MAVIGIEMYFEKAANIPEATVLTSMDCGATWTSDYNFSRPLPTNFFLQNAVRVPPACVQWPMRVRGY